MNFCLESWIEYNLDGSLTIETNRSPIRDLLGFPGLTGEIEAAQDGHHVECSRRRIVGQRQRDALDRAFAVR